LWKDMENTEENDEMTWKIWKIPKLNGENIWIIRKKPKLNSNVIWKIQENIEKRYENYGRKQWNDMENMEERQVE
jgi:hypothetical protein